MMEMDSAGSAGSASSAGSAGSASEWAESRVTGRNARRDSRVINRNECEDLQDREEKFPEFSEAYPEKSRSRGCYESTVNWIYERGLRKTAFQFGAAVMVVYAIYERSRLLAAIESVASLAFTQFVAVTPAAIQPSLISFKVLVLSDPRIFLVCAGVGLLIWIWATRKPATPPSEINPEQFLKVLSSRTLALDGAIRLVANSEITDHNKNVKMQALRVAQQELQDIITRIEAYRPTEESGRFEEVREAEEDIANVDESESDLDGLNEVGDALDDNSLKQALEMAKEAVNQAHNRQYDQNPQSISRVPYPALYLNNSSKFDEHLYQEKAGVSFRDLGWLAELSNHHPSAPLRMRVER